MSIFIMLEYLGVGKPVKQLQIFPKPGSYSSESGGGLLDYNHSVRAHLKSSPSLYAEIAVNDSAIVCISGSHLFFRAPYALEPQISAFDGTWQTVTGTRYQFFIFSAYYDSRDVDRLPVVRIIGTTFDPDPVSCLLWYQKNKSHTKVEARFEAIGDHRNLSYSAYFILCPVAIGMGVPHSVSIVAGNSIPLNRLLVNDYFTNSCATDTMKFCVCVQPISFNYDKALQLIEFLEMYRILGVEQFYVYTTAMSNRTACILQHYHSKGGLKVLFYENIMSNDEIRAETAFSAWNDCSYRSAKESITHLVMVDLDEIIIPNHHDTLPEFIRHIDAERRGSHPYGHYNFRKAFYYKDDKIASKSPDPFERALMILRKTRRLMNTSAAVGRSIILPIAAIEVDDNLVRRAIDGYDGVFVEEHLGLVHQYGSLHANHVPAGSNVESFIDLRAYRYKEQILTAVKVAWMELQEKCGLDDVVTESGKLYEPGMPQTYQENLTAKCLKKEEK